MKKTIFFLCLLFSASVVFAQKNFEGVLVYKTNVVSKLEGISNATWKKILNLSDDLTVAVKNGNFKQTYGRGESYFFGENGKSYFTVKGYDSLYYRDVSSDTSTVLSVTKNDNKKLIAGYNCNSITIRTTGGTFTYFYTPSIYMNPQLTQNYWEDREDIFYKETSSLFLGMQQETNSYTYTLTCVSVEPKAIDANIFELPNLPQQKSTAASFIKYPEFSGKEGWASFLSKNIDSTVAAKYLKIGRKENTATQTVNVTFMVSETGNVYNVLVDNKKDVHPKLAEEAMRVINISHWHPATVFNQAVPYKVTQSIIFQVTKQ